MFTERIRACRPCPERESGAPELAFGPAGPARQLLPSGGGMRGRTPERHASQRSGTGEERGGGAPATSSWTALFLLGQDHLATAIVMGGEVSSDLFLFREGFSKSGRTPRLEGREAATRPQTGPSAKLHPPMRCCVRGRPVRAAGGGEGLQVAGFRLSGIRYGVLAPFSVSVSSVSLW